MSDRNRSDRPVAGPLRYPPARRDDETQDFFGVAVTTPFRWLDDPLAEDTRAWIAAQNALTDSFLDPESVERNVRFLERFSEEPPRLLPIVRGRWRYALEQRPGEDQPSLLCDTLPETAPAPNETGAATSSTRRLVIDPAARGGALDAELLSVSPSGRYVAYGFVALGEEGGAIQVWDAVTGRELDEVIAPTAVPSVAWHPGERGFFYNVTRRILGAEVAGQHDGVYWHRLGRPIAEDRLLIPLDATRADAGPIHGLHPFIPDGGEVLFVVATNYVTSARGLAFWALPDDPESGLGTETLLLRDAEAPLAWLGSRGRIHYFSTRLEAPLGRVLAIDLDSPARDQWRVLVPEASDALTTDPYAVRARLGAVCGDRLLLTYLHHASHRVRLFDLEGGERGELPLPPLVTVEEIAPIDNGDAWISTVDLLRPQALYRWRRSAGAGSPAAGSLELEHASVSPLRADDFTVEQLFVYARDGVRVPMTVVRPRRLDPATPAPTFLYGYGGWGQSITPRYSPDAALWLSRGGVYAYANLRGGGEYGDAWRAAGQSTRKQTVFDDFQAAAERLIADGVTTPDQLGIKGLSNGGLLTAACYNQRPELYGAVIAEIPLADVLWLDRTDKGRAVAAELGNPRESRRVFEALRAYSPLQNVEPRPHQPALLVVVAENDDSAPPGQAYRFTAACQAVARDGQLVLLRTLPGVAHVGWPRRVMVRALAEEVAFFEAVLIG